MAPAQSPCPPWAGTHILIPGVPQIAGQPQGWVTRVGPTGYTQLTLSASQLRALVTHYGMQTSSQIPPGAWLGHLRGRCRARGVREVTLSQNQSREWLGTLRKAGEQGAAPRLCCHPGRGLGGGGAWAGALCPSLASVPPDSPTGPPRTSGHGSQAEPGSPSGLPPELAWPHNRGSRLLHL